MEQKIWMCEIHDFNFIMCLGSLILDHIIKMILAKRIFMEQKKYG